MRILGGSCVALLFATGLFAQQYKTGQPVLTGGGASWVPLPPSSVSGTLTGARNPFLTAPHLVIPGSNRNNRPAAATAGAPYAYPVYVGGYGGLSGNGYDTTNGAPPVQQPTNVTVVTPPPPAPVIINNYFPGSLPPQQALADQQPMSAYQPAIARQDDDTTSNHYLFAFKDHTIYAAVAYWVDGDTLHYFTAGNKHNQVSVTLLDRELTDRLNKDSGLDLSPANARQ